MSEVNLQINSVMINGKSYVPYEEFERFIRELDLNVETKLNLKKNDTIVEK